LALLSSKSCMTAPVQKGGVQADAAIAARAASRTERNDMHIAQVLAYRCVRDKVSSASSVVEFNQLSQPLCLNGGGADSNDSMLITANNDLDAHGTSNIGLSTKFSNGQMMPFVRDTASPNALSMQLSSLSKSSGGSSREHFGHINPLFGASSNMNRSSIVDVRDDLSHSSEDQFSSGVSDDSGDHLLSSKLISLKDYSVRYSVESIDDKPYSRDLQAEGQVDGTSRVDDSWISPFNNVIYYYK
jgi:hypothetical protein